MTPSAREAFTTFGPAVLFATVVVVISLPDMSATRIYGGGYLIAYLGLIGLILGSAAIGCVCSVRACLRSPERGCVVLDQPQQASNTGRVGVTEHAAAGFQHSRAPSFKRTPNGHAGTPDRNFGLTVLFTLAAVFAVLAKPLVEGQHLEIWWQIPVATIGVIVLFHHYISGQEELPAARATGLALITTGLLVAGISLYRWAIDDFAMELGLLDPLNREAGATVLKADLGALRNAHPFGHQNYLAGFCLLMLPWAVWGLIRGAGRWRVVSLFATVLIGGALVSTQSRGAFLGLAAVGATLPLLLRARGTLTSRRFWQWVVGGLILGALLLTLNPRLRDSATRLVTQGTTGVDLIRENMLVAGWRMGINHPFTGVGVGNVTRDFPLYRGSLNGGLEDVYQLHSTPVQLWAEYGAAGLAAVLALIALVTRRFLRILRTADPARFAIAAAAAVSLLGYAVFSVTDHQLDVPGIWLPLAANVGLLLGLGRPNPGDASASRRLPLILAACFVIACGAAAIDSTREVAARQQLRTLARQGAPFDPTAAERLVRFGGDNPYYHNQLAALNLARSYEETNLVQRAGLRSTAAEWLRRSLDELPHQEFCHYNLAWLTLEDDPALAADYFILSARLVPDRRGVYLGLGRALMALGRREAAIRSFALECVVDPKRVSSPVWRLEELAGLRPEIERAVLDFYTGEIASTSDVGMRQQYEQRRALTAWWLNGTPPEADVESSFHALHHDFFALLAGDQSVIPESPFERLPHQELYLAWNNPADRELHLQRSYMMSTRRRLPEDLSARLLDWLDQPGWENVVRTMPPEELQHAFQRQRSGYSLLARNYDGVKPTDVPVHLDNYVVSLYFEFYFGGRWGVPSPVVLQRLQSIARDAGLEWRALQGGFTAQK